MEIQKVFNGTNITVLPIQGNHDTWPVNVQDFDKPNSNIPINAFADAWIPWLGEDIIASFRQYGYYSMPLKLKDGRVYENTRIIGINTQACNNMNWWLIKKQIEVEQQHVVSIYQSRVIAPTHVYKFHFDKINGLQLTGIRVQYLADDRQQQGHLPNTNPKTRISIADEKSLVPRVSIFKNRYDPGNEIEWLQGELDALEKVNGTAIYMTHIPTNGDCVHGWGHRFRGLMERYQHIVRFGLFGHTHNEQITVVKSVSSVNGNGTAPQNIGVNYVAGSLTTDTEKNPAFSVIEIDEEFMVPINFKTYYYEIPKANREGKITWELLHDFTRYYGMKDLSPDTIQTFAERLRDDEAFAILYKWNSVRQAQGQRRATCDADCRLANFCDMTSTEYFQYQICMGRPTYDFINEPGNAIFNLLVNPWLEMNSTVSFAEKKKARDEAVKVASPFKISDLWSPAFYSAIIKNFVGQF